MPRIRKINPQNNNLLKKSPKNTTWDLALKEFIHFKKAQGLSESTLGDYKRFIEQFFTRFPIAFESDYSALRKNVLEFMADPIKPATYNLRLIYISAFFKFCIDEGYLAENPFQGFKKRKSQPRIVEIPADMLQKLLLLPDQSTYAGLRDYALILLTLDTGIRPKEAFSLKITDFNFKYNSVTISSDIAKTRTERILPISPITMNSIQHLISVRHPDWETTVPVFSTTEGTYSNRNTWGDRLEVYSKKLNFQIRPYDLRHCFAIYYLRGGGNAFTLQKTLGHQDLSMSKRYLNITSHDLKDIHLQSTPLNVLIPNKTKKERLPSVRKKL